VDEATPLTGGLRFALVEGGSAGAPKASAAGLRRGARGGLRGVKRGKRR